MMSTNKGNYLADLGNIYDGIIDQLIAESTKKATSKGLKSVKNTFPMAGDKKSQKKAESKPFVHKNSGPEGVDGFNKDIIDTKKGKAKKDNFYTPEKFSQQLEKTESTPINNYMKFDNLFNKVIKHKLQLEEVEGDETTPEDIAALPETGSDVDAGAGETEEETPEEEMTPSELIAKALSLLQLAQSKIDEEGMETPGEIEDETGEGEATLEDGEDAEGGMPAGEATEMEELKDSAGEQLMKPGKQKVDSEQSKLAKGGKADGKVTDKVGNDGDYGTPLVDKPKGDLNNPKKSQVVQSKLKTGQTLGAQ